MAKRKTVRAREGGKKSRAKRPSSKKWEKYTASGENLSKGEFCPRCGEGVFMAKHKGRQSCGRCSYTVFEN